MITELLDEHDVARAFRGGDAKTIVAALRQDGYELIELLDAAVEWVETGCPVTQTARLRSAALHAKAESEGQ